MPARAGFSCCRPTPGSEGPTVKANRFKTNASPGPVRAGARTGVVSLFVAGWWLARVAVADPGMVATNPASAHWAFQPVRPVAVPAASTFAKVEPAGRAASRHPVDAFLLSARQGQPLAPRADRSMLLRRATFDLTGLPPTPEERAEFLRDPSPDAEALARVVDRLLASPRYGERWGRHWMDVVRYADTAGDNADYPVPEAYRYRDYIIDSFNRDKPYDQFVREQLAGDILAAGEGGAIYAERVTATGFLALSRRYATAPFEFMHLTIEDAIETTGRAFLGMTFRCARCHDHKYDPVTREDYYALYGLFESTRFPYAGSEEFQSKKFPRSGFQPLLPPADAGPLQEAHRAQIESINEAIKKCEQALSDAKKAGAATNGAGAPAGASSVVSLEAKLKALQSECSALQRSGGPESLPMAYAVGEGSPVDARLQPRGEPGEAGPPVPRRAPRFLTGTASLNIPAGSSGRREFAEWLTRPENPLTARVMVNRIWQQHFGRGLVATPSNFGLRGDRPTHPELLDYLAGRLVNSGWSIKAMHRLIMTSDAYAQASGGREPGAAGRRGASGAMAGRGARISQDPAPSAPDPFSPFPRRRLSAEEIRDAMLMVAGTLDLTRPGAHPFPRMAEWSWTQHNPFKAVYDSNHRSVYLMTQRLQRHPYLGLFDAPDANVSTDVRTDSTVPLQALYLINNPWVEEQARALARRLTEVERDEGGRVRLGVLWAWGREPTGAEVQRAGRFLAEVREESSGAGEPQEQREMVAWTSYARVLLTANEFFYVD